MPCDELSDLQKAYQDAVRDYAKSVSDLRKNGVGVAVTEFMLLWKLAQRSKHECNVANRAVQNHILAHRCANLAVY